MEQEKKGKAGTPASQVDLQAMIQAMAQAMAQVMAQTQQQAAPTDEWTVVEEPLKKEVSEDEQEALGNLVSKPSRDVSTKKKLIGYPTGTFLDSLFIGEDEATPLGGLPICGQVAITGLPGAGKSILTMEVALKVAHDGHKVLYVTSEDVFVSDTPRFDLQSRLIRKAELLKLDWDKVSENLWIMDAASYSELREWSKFIRTYCFACETRGIDFAIIDSITLLETLRGTLKYRVSEITRYNQKKGITAIFINQRSSEDVDVFGMAGGITLGHTYDAIIIMDHCYVYSVSLLAELQKYGIKRGQFARFSRILDCSICGYKRDYLLLDIDDHGFLRPITAKIPISRSAKQEEGEETS